jgi:hypothetical protein
MACIAKTRCVDPFPASRTYRFPGQNISRDSRLERAHAIKSHIRERIKIDIPNRVDEWTPRPGSDPDPGDLR